MPLITGLTTVPHAEHFTKRLADGHGGGHLPEVIGKDGLKTPTYRPETPFSEGRKVDPTENNPPRGKGFKLQNPERQRQQSATLAPDQSKTIARFQQNAEIVNQHFIFNPVLKPPPAKARAFQREVFKFEEIHDR